MQTLLALIFACLFLAWDAQARVSVVNDGADGASARIRIQSAIHKGDLAEFQAAVDQVSRTAKTRINDTPFITVELNSPGGDVVEAVGIGRVIYQHAAMTLVGLGQECVSACVFILMAGAVHTPSGGAAIGVHRPLLLSWRHMDYREARAKYDGLMRYLHDYFVELGVSETAYDIMMRTDSEDMRYFSPAELDQFRLRGEGPQWRLRFARQQAAQPAIEQIDIAADLPTLPKIDESYRYVVFMPGALPVGKDYLAGVDIHDRPVVLDTLDDGTARLFVWFPPPDIIAFLRGIRRVVEPGWWLMALLVFELMRGGVTVWPDHPSHRRRDQWRLAPLQPGFVNPASAQAPVPLSRDPARYGGSGSSTAH